MEPRRFGYARVSTDEQDALLQRRALAREGILEVYEDTMSGARSDRPKLQELLREIQPGDTVVVWKLDRLGRRAVDLLTLAENFAARGIRLVSLTEGVDVTTSAGKMFLTMLAGWAEFERDLIRERTDAGLKAARAMGRFGGRRRVLTGKRLERAKAMFDNPPISPNTGKKMTRPEIAALFKVSVMTLIRECLHGGVPVQKKLQDRFLQLHPDVDEWLSLTEDPLYGRNIDKLNRNQSAFIPRI